MEHGRSRRRTITRASRPRRGATRPTADLRALEESRREVASAIGDHEESVAALRSRRRPRRQRREPDSELSAAEANLGYYQRQAERLDLEIAALHASQHRRPSHLAEHRADAAELADINKTLAERLRQQTSHVVLDPPNYIDKVLGPRPHDSTTDRAWVRAVAEIERYRLDQGIGDGRTAIGQHPAHNREAIHAWHRVRCAIADARAAIGLEHEPDIRLRRRPEGPSLEIGL